MGNGLFKTKNGNLDRCEITHDSCTLSRCNTLQGACGAYTEKTLKPGKYSQVIADALQRNLANNASELGNAVLICKNDVHGVLLGYLKRRKG